MSTRWRTWVAFATVAAASAYFFYRSQSPFIVTAASGRKFERHDVAPVKLPNKSFYKDPTNLVREIEEDLRFPAGMKHTMKDLDGYCLSKIFLSRDTIDHFLQEGYTIEVQGVYPEHVKEWAEGHKLRFGEGSLLSYGKSQERCQIEKGNGAAPRKRYNTERPQWYIFPDEKRLVLTVFPGRDYTKHFGHIVRYYLNKEWGDLGRNRFAGCWYYPSVIESMANWTKLEEFVGDLSLAVVVMGYVDELYDTLNKFEKVTPKKERDLSPWKEGCMYGKREVLNSSGCRIIFLGVGHSYWGETSKYIVQALYKAGAQEVIYAAKCGTLSLEKYVLGVSVPSQYKLVQLAGGTKTEHVNTHNSIYDLVKGHPILDDRSISLGIHASVPDIVGESQQEYQALKDYGASTIDNEIAYMASVVPVGRRFSSCHFITDHLKSEEELKQLKDDPRFDLTLMARRTAESEQIVAKAKNRMRDIVNQYLRSWSPVQSDMNAFRGLWSKYVEVDWKPFLEMTKKRLVINVSYLKSWIKDNEVPLIELFKREVVVELYLPDHQKEDVMAMLRDRFWYKSDNEFSGTKKVLETVNLLNTIREKANAPKEQLEVHFVPWLQSYSLYVFDNKMAALSFFSEAAGELNIPSPVVLVNMDNPTISNFVNTELKQIKKKDRREKL